jgi:hypothetical protein
VFAIELTILILGVLLLSLLSLARDWMRMRRIRRLGERTEAQLRTILDRTAEAAEALFGAADEINEGTSGRRLFVWKQPGKEGLLTLMATVSESGVVEQVSWKLNREERA